MLSVGQKVVCIADYAEAAASSWAQDLCVELPVKGEVYTVRRIVQRPCAGDVYCGIMLAEVLNLAGLLDKDGVGGMIEIGGPRAMFEPDEVAFDSRDFRPLIMAGDFATTTVRVSA